MGDRDLSKAVAARLRVANLTHPSIHALRGPIPVKNDITLIERENQIFL
jgi:hypothetical protein